MKFDGIIFDWAGTTVDYGCFAPVKAFIEAFEQFGITPTLEEVRKPMGMLKIHHVRTMLSMDSGKKNRAENGQRKTSRGFTNSVRARSWKSYITMQSPSLM